MATIYADPVVMAFRGSTRTFEQTQQLFEWMFDNYLGQNCSRLRHSQIFFFKLTAYLQPNSSAIAQFGVDVGRK